MSNQVTHRDVWRLSWPLIVSNCSVPLLGIVDTALLGHLDSPIFLGAVAVGSSILAVLLWTFGFLRMGTTSEVARACGRNDAQHCSLLFTQSVFLALIVALVLMLLSPWLFRLGISWMAPESKIADLTFTYCLIRISSAPATLITYVMVGWFIGMQRTREPLIVVVFVNSLNIILDWLLIVVFDLNSNGAALATVVAEYCGLALGLYLLLRRLPGGWLRLPLRMLWRQSSALLQVHGDLLIRTLCLLFAFAFFTAQGARQGDIVLAANAILLQLLTLVSHGLDGYAHAAEALVGKACGAGDRRNLRRAFRYTALWSAVTALLFTAVFAIARDPLLHLFTDIPAVLVAAHHYFPWLLALPLLSFVCYWLDGVFIGAGKTRAMRNTIIGACFGVFLPLWWVLQKLTISDASSTEFNNHGLWIAFLGFNLARGLIMAYYARRFFRSDRWFNTPMRA